MNAKELIAMGARDLKRGAKNFSWTGQEKIEAEELLEHALGRSPRDGEAIPPAVARRFHGYVERRITGEPIPYIRGWTEFHGLRLAVRPGAFVPRQTTEFLAKEAIRRLRSRRAPIAVDIATGIGPVALAIAASLRRARVYGADINPVAVRQARANATSLRLSNASFHAGSLFEPLPASIHGKVDSITLHPPYIPRGEIRDLPAEMKQFEPMNSLTDRSSDGLGLVRMMMESAPEWLRAGGWILVDVSPDLARPIASMYRRAGLRDVRSIRHPWNLTRVVAGRR